MLFIDILPLLTTASGIRPAPALDPASLIVAPRPPGDISKAFIEVGPTSFISSAYSSEVINIVPSPEMLLSPL